MNVIFFFLTNSSFYICNNDFKIVKRIPISKLIRIYSEKNHLIIVAYNTIYFESG